MKYLMLVFLLFSQTCYAGCASDCDAGDTDCKTDCASGGIQCAKDCDSGDNDCVKNCHSDVKPVDASKATLASLELNCPLTNAKGDSVKELASILDQLNSNSSPNCAEKVRASMGEQYAKLTNDLHALQTAQQRLTAEYTVQNNGASGVSVITGVTPNNLTADTVEDISNNMVHLMAALKSSDAECATDETKASVQYALGRYTASLAATAAPLPYAGAVASLVSVAINFFTNSFSQNNGELISTQIKNIDDGSVAACGYIKIFRSFVGDCKDPVSAAENIPSECSSEISLLEKSSVGELYHGISGLDSLLAKYRDDNASKDNPNTQLAMAELADSMREKMASKLSSPVLGATTLTEFLQKAQESFNAGTSVADKLRAKQLSSLFLALKSDDVIEISSSLAKVANSLDEYINRYFKTLKEKSKEESTLSAIQQYEALAQIESTISDLAKRPQQALQNKHPGMDYERLDLGFNLMMTRAQREKIIAYVKTRVAYAEAGLEDGTPEFCQAKLNAAKACGFLQSAFFLGNPSKKNLSRLSLRDDSSYYQDEVCGKYINIVGDPLAKIDADPNCHDSRDDRGTFISDALHSSSKRAHDCSAEFKKQQCQATSPNKVDEIKANILKAFPKCSSVVY